MTPAVKQDEYDPAEEYHDAADPCAIPALEDDTLAPNAEKLAAPASPRRMASRRFVPGSAQPLAEPKRRRAEEQKPVEHQLASVIEAMAAAHEACAAKAETKGQESVSPPCPGVIELAWPLQRSTAQEWTTHMSLGETKVRGPRD